MALPADDGRFTAWLDYQHPILGNSDLLGQVEDRRSLPEASNVTKEGFGEKGKVVFPLLQVKKLTSRRMLSPPRQVCTLQSTSCPFSHSVRFMISERKSA
jgi:hypothetical protein